jgi:amino acid transporter
VRLVAQLALLLFWCHPADQRHHLLQNTARLANGQDCNANSSKRAGGEGVRPRPGSTPRGTPTNALILQGAVALVLVGFGAIARSGFEAMVAYTAPVFWLMLLLCGVALFVLRRRHPDLARPFAVPGYPITPALFCAASAFMLYASVAHAGAGALLGLGVMAAAVPVFLLGRR